MAEKLLLINSLAREWLSASAIASAALQPVLLPSCEVRPITVVQVISSGMHTSRPFTVHASKTDSMKSSLSSTLLPSR